MKIKEDEFWEYWEKFDYPNIERALRVGLDFDFDINHYVQQASWMNDFHMLYVFWKCGTRAPTPFIENIFKRFDAGDTADILKKEEQSLLKNEVKKDIKNLTHNFSIKNLPIENVYFTLNKEIWLDLHIQFSAFLYESNLIKPQSLIFSLIVDSSELNRLAGKEIFYDKEDFDESFYLYSSHNPVDLVVFKVINVNGKDCEVEFTLRFDFSYEKNGQEEFLTINKQIVLTN